MKRSIVVLVASLLMLGLNAFPAHAGQAEWLPGDFVHHGASWLPGSAASADNAGHAILKGKTSGHAKATWSKAEWGGMFVPLSELRSEDATRAWTIFRFAYSLKSRGNVQVKATMYLNLEQDGCSESATLDLPDTASQDIVFYASSFCDRLTALSDPDAIEMRFEFTATAASPASYDFTADVEDASVTWY